MTLFWATRARLTFPPAVKRSLPSTLTYVEINNDENPNFNEPLKRVEKFLDAPVTAKARDWVSKAQLQKTVAQEDVQSKPKVYVDMDGVIANFYAGVTRVTGHAEPRELAFSVVNSKLFLNTFVTYPTLIWSAISGLIL